MNLKAIIVKKTVWFVERKSEINFETQITPIVYKFELYRKFSLFGYLLSYN